MGNDSQTLRVRRSELTTPAGSARMIESAATKGEADVVILDLEDATAEGEKEQARRVLVETARELDWGSKVLAVRVNPVGSQWFEREMREVVVGLGPRLQAIVVPKVETAEDIVRVDRLVGELEEEAGRDPGAIALEALIESPRAVLDLEPIAAASRRLEALIFGVADYAARVGARLGEDVFTDFMYAKQRLVTVARANELAPIDCVTFQYADLDLTRRDAQRAARMGFEGKWCVHPGQVPVVNEAFTPTKEEVVWAERVVAAFEQAEQEGRGALTVGSEMVDRATVRVAERLLASNRRAKSPS